MEPTPLIEHFRQILIWPLKLETSSGSAGIRNHWDLLTNPSTRGTWREVADEFTEDPADFSERHYFEFVNFLPFVQRFLYGEASVNGVAGDGRLSRASPIRTFRRADVKSARVTLRGRHEPILFNVAHTDIYFFFDTDIAILTVELYAEDLPLNTALEALDSIRRAYPIHWEKPDATTGRTHATRCPVLVEWLGVDDSVIAASDYEDKQSYLAFACRHRAPRAARHWDKLLEPIVHFYDPEAIGPVRYRQIEDDRIPSMVYLACDDPGLLHRADFVRMAFGTRKGQAASLPYSSSFLEDFESRYCYDRYWETGDEGRWRGARYLCTGAMFTVVGCQRDDFFTEPGTGILGQYRHLFFMLGLIAHFHKAALLALADRLSQAVSRLDPSEPQSLRAFQREVRHDLEEFLRFNHRYWFQDVSNQLQASDLFHMWSRHLGNAALFNDVRQKTHDINEYLDSNRSRKLADTGVRLGVVATFGFIGAIATSFMGMNVIDETHNPIWVKIVIVGSVLIPTLALTLYTVAISRRLADFLDVVSSEKLGWKHKALAALDIWKRRPLSSVGDKRDEVG